jgi:hypothetical protein
VSYVREGPETSDGFDGKSRHVARFPLEAFQRAGVMARAGDPRLDPTLNPRLRGMRRVLAGQESSGAPDGCDII